MSVCPVYRLSLSRTYAHTLTVRVFLSIVFFFLYSKIAQAIDRCVLERPDLLLLDIHMPVKNGIEAARDLRSMPEFARLPIVAISADMFAPDNQVFLRAGLSIFCAVYLTFGWNYRLVSCCFRHDCRCNMCRIVLCCEATLDSNHIDRVWFFMLASLPFPFFLSHETSLLAIAGDVRAIHGHDHQTGEPGDSL